MITAKNKQQALVILKVSSLHINFIKKSITIFLQGNLFWIISRPVAKMPLSTRYKSPGMYPLKWVTIKVTVKPTNIEIIFLSLSVGIISVC